MPPADEAAPLRRDELVLIGPMGPMGAGKRTLGPLLAARLGVP